MALGPRPRPYKDFLTPSLHRRFADACLNTLALCYLIAIWMGDWNNFFWSWFPISLVGVRTLLLLIPALLVYLLRVSTWHIGQRNTGSPYETLVKYALGKRTFGTIVVYGLSAWFYSEVYIWSRSGKDRLEFTDHGRPHERIKLNERPVYLRFLFVSLAVGQAIMHLYLDYDQVRILVPQTKQAQKDPRSELWKRLVPLATKAGMTACSTFVIGSVVYFAGIRHIIWNVWYSFMKNFIALAKTSKPTGLPPFINLTFMFLWEGTWLALLWQFSNKTFNLYMAEEPLKKGKPITTDSTDANGSLLNGLKSSKGDAKYSAFWELALITERFEDRRKTIYGELARPKGATHKQVADVCLAEIRGIIQRVDKATDFNYRPDEDGKKTTAPAIQLVPQISQPLRDAQITGPSNPPVTRWEQVGSVTSGIARNYSSPQNVQNSKAGEYLRKGQGKAQEGIQEAQSKWAEYREKMARSPFGWFFRYSLRRTANVVVNDTPYSRQSIIFNAITILTNLTVCSLKEDDNGQWQNEVADIVRVFTAAVKKIEAYMQGLQVHWTDVETLAKPEAERKKVPEVDEVTAALKEGLEKILGAFNEYLAGMGMSRAELQDAKKLVAKETPQMIQAGR